MFRRPLFLLFCLYFAGWILARILIPGFPLENRTTKVLEAAAGSGETVRVQGIAEAVRQLEGGSCEVTLRKVTVVLPGDSAPERSDRIRVRRLRLILDRTYGKQEKESGGYGESLSAAVGSIEAAAGCSLTACGELEAVRRPTNPGEFDPYLYERLKGCPYRLSGTEVQAVSGRITGLSGWLWQIRSAVRARIGHVYPAYSRGVIAALLIGDRSLMADGQSELWRMSGTAHIMAISGLHLTLIGMALFGLLRRLNMPLLPAAAISSAALFAYALMTGLSLSTMRALIMFLYVMGSRVAGRAADRLSALSLAALSILLEDPAYLLDAGFQLSFATAATLAVFAGAGRLKMACLLMLFPLPIVAWHYYELPLFGLVFNLIIIPCVPSVLILGMTGTLFGGYAAYPASGLVYLAEAAFRLIGSYLPLTFVTGRPVLWQYPLYYLMLTAGVLVFYRNKTKKRRLILLLFIPVLFIALKRPAPREFSLTMLDVGQGDSFIVTCPGGMTCLIDCGSSSVNDVGERRLIPYLKYEGIRKAEYIFVTHFDEDHISGLCELLNLIAERRTSLRVGTIVLPYRESCEEIAGIAGEAGVRLLMMQIGDRLCLPAGRRKAKETLIEALGPDPAVSYQSGNAASLVLAIHYGNFDALMTGDVMAEGEEALTDTLREEQASSKNRGQTFEVLKVAHHGSRTSTSGEFLNLAAPGIALISCGKNNLYGHPHEEVLERLGKAGTQAFRSDEDGAVRVISDGSRFESGTFVPSVGMKAKLW